MIAIAGFILIFVSLLGIAFALERIYAKRQARLGRLICMYNNYETAHRVLRREIWQGQTEAQLLHSRGDPAMKNRLLAIPEREEWTYTPRRPTRCRLRVILENGSVTAWDSDR
ncbi:MAG: hypothetical protein ABSD70_06905 [Terracidiphilus sp.]|jgi:hypothetical protein